MASKKNKGLVYCCTTCQYLGTRKDAFSHFLCKHVEEDRVPYRCSVCGFRALEEAQFQLHLPSPRHLNRLKKLSKENRPVSEAIISSNPYLIQWDDAPQNSRDLMRLSPEDSKQHWEARAAKTGTPECDLLAEAVKVAGLETPDVDVSSPTQDVWTNTTRIAKQDVSVGPSEALGAPMTYCPPVVMVNLNHEELLPIIKTAVAESIKGCSSAVTASVRREPTPLGQAMGSISAQILRSSEIQRETNSKLDEMAVDKALERKVMTDILKELRTLNGHMQDIKALQTTTKATMEVTSDATQASSVALAETARLFARNTASLGAKIKDLTHEASSSQETLGRLVQDQTRAFRRVAAEVEGLNEFIRQGGNSGLVRDILDLGNEEPVMNLVPDHLQESQWLNVAAHKNPSTAVQKAEMSSTTGSNLPNEAPTPQPSESAMTPQPTSSMSEDLTHMTVSPSRVSAAPDDGILIISEEHDSLDCDVPLPRKTPKRPRSPEGSSPRKSLKSVVARSSSKEHDVRHLPHSKSARKSQGPITWRNGRPTFDNRGIPRRQRRGPRLNSSRNLAQRRAAFNRQRNFYNRVIFSKNSE